MDQDKLAQNRIQNAILLAKLVNWKFVNTNENVSWNKGRFQYIDITADITLTFSNPSAGTTYVLKFNNPDGHTITWPSNCRWPGGYIPSTGICYVGFLYIDNISSQYYDNIALAEDLQII